MPLNISHLGHAGMVLPLSQYQNTVYVLTGVYTCQHVYMLKNINKYRKEQTPWVTQLLHFQRK